MVFSAAEFCTDKSRQVKMVNDKIKNHNLNRLDIEINDGGPNETFCLPHFVDFPAFNRLTFKSSYLLRSGTKLSVPDNFTDLLRGLNNLTKFVLNTWISSRYVIFSRKV